MAVIIIVEDDKLLNEGQAYAPQKAGPPFRRFPRIS